MSDEIDAYVERLVRERDALRAEVERLKRSRDMRARRARTTGPAERLAERFSRYEDELDGFLDSTGDDDGE